MGPDHGRRENAQRDLDQGRSKLSLGDPEAVEASPLKQPKEPKLVHIERPGEKHREHVEVDGKTRYAFYSPNSELRQAPLCLRERITILVDEVRAQEVRVEALEDLAADINRRLKLMEAADVVGDV
jgi:hypothetical protein